MLYIKPYSFSDFVDQGWEKWKFSTLQDAVQRIENNPLIKEMAYQAQNVSKSPIPYDESDWEYLSQFPFAYWKDALRKRYSDLLLQNAKKRHQAFLGLQTPEEKAAHKASGGYEHASDEEGELKLSSGGAKGEHVFKNVKTGAKSLMQKLEKPIKPRKAHDQDTPGIEEIGDAMTGDIHHPSKDQYQGGHFDYDLSNPHEVTDDWIDNNPDIKNKEYAKKHKQNMFEGMPVMQESTADESLTNWLLAQALGLLGEAPATKQGYPVKYVNVSQLPGAPRKLAQAFESLRQRMPNAPNELKIPVIEKNIEGFGLTPVPVLNKTRFLPGVWDWSEQQREQLKARRNQKGDTGQIGDVGGMLKNFDLLTPEQKQHLMDNQRDPIHYITREAHRDPWTRHSNREPYEKDAGLGTSTKAGFYTLGFNPNYSNREVSPLPEDPLPAFNKYFQVFHNEAAKVLSGIDPEDVSGKKAEKGGYLGKLREKDWPSDVVDMLEAMIFDIQNVAALRMCLQLNSRAYGVYDPKVGLENHRPGEAGAKKSESYRMEWYKQFLHDMSQKGLTAGQPGRRQRQQLPGFKKRTKKSLQQQLGTDADASNLGAVTAAPAGGGAAQVGGGQGAQYYNPNTGEIETGTGAAEKGGYKPHRVYLVPQQGGVAGAQEIIPLSVLKMTPFITGFKYELTKTRNLLVGRIGENNQFMGKLKQAEERNKAELETLERLTQTAAQELQGQGLSEKDLALKAKSIALGKVVSTLKAERPELFAGKEGEKELEQIPIRHRQEIEEEPGGFGGTEEKEEGFMPWAGQYAATKQHVDWDAEKQEEEDLQMNDFFSELLSQTGAAIAPMYDVKDKTFVNGPMFHIEDVFDALKTHGQGKGYNADAKFIVQLISNIWNQEGAAKYAIPLLMAYAKNKGEPIDQATAARAVQQAGVAVKVAPSPETIKVPQRAPTAAAAMDVTGMLADPVTNIQQIMQNKAELTKPQNRQALQQTFEKLRATLLAKYRAGQELSDAESQALDELGEMLE